MSNQIFLSAGSFQKYFDRYPAEHRIDLPIVGTVVVNAKELRFNSGRLSLPVHHKIPLVPDFEISLEEFRCHGTGLSFEIGRIGILSGNALQLFCQALAGTIGKKLGETNVQLSENRISVEAVNFLPGELREIRLIQLQIASGSDAGVRIEFEY